MNCDVGQPIRQPISMCKPKRGSFTGIISPSRQGLILADFFLQSKKEDTSEKSVYDYAVLSYAKSKFGVNDSSDLVLVVIYRSTWKLYQGQTRCFNSQSKEPSFRLLSHMNSPIFFIRPYCVSIFRYFVSDISNSSLATPPSHRRCHLFLSFTWSDSTITVRTNFTKMHH